MMIDDYMYTGKIGQTDYSELLFPFYCIFNKGL